MNRYFNKCTFVSFVRVLVDLMVPVVVQWKLINVSTTSLVGELLLKERFSRTGQDSWEYCEYLGNERSLEYYKDNGFEQSKPTSYSPSISSKSQNSRRRTNKCATAVKNYVPPEIET